MSQRHLTVRALAGRLRCTDAGVHKMIHRAGVRVVVTSTGLRVPLSGIAALTSPAFLSCDAKVAGQRGHPRNAVRDGLDYDAITLVEELMLNDHLSLAEAATYIGRSTRTVRRWVEIGRLPRAKRVVQRLLIPKADLDALVQIANPDALAAS